MKSFILGFALFQYLVFSFWQLYAIALVCQPKINTRFTIKWSVYEN